MRNFEDEIDTYFEEHLQNRCFWMSSQTAIKSNICFLNWMKWGKIYIFVSLWYYYICILSRSSRNEVFFKKVFLKTSQNSQENTCNGVSFLSTASNFIKKDISFLWHVFSCELCNIFKNILLYWPPPMAASFGHKMQNICVNKFSTIFIHNIFEYH